MGFHETDMAQAAPARRISVIDEIAAERRRQVEAEGWTPHHDDEHSSGELAKAAACYALGSKIETPMPAAQVGAWERSRKMVWPWDLKWWKPKDRRRDLVRAGALIVAEIERIDRAAGKH